MAELIDQIAAVIQAIIQVVGYPGIFAMQFIENVFPPFPTDTMLPFSGVVAASGRLNVVGVWLAAVLGSLAGSLVLYSLGKWADEQVVNRLIGRYGAWFGITDTGMRKATGWFNRYGAPVIILGRLVPVMRSVISLTAGISRTPLPVFVACTTISAGGAMGFWVGIGYLLGENWRVILDFVDHFEPLIWLAIVIVGVVGVVLLARRLVVGRALLQEPGGSAD